MSTAKAMKSSPDDINDFMRLFGNMDILDVVEEWPSPGIGNRYNEKYPDTSISALNVIRDCHRIILSRAKASEYYYKKSKSVVENGPVERPVKDFDVSQEMTLAMTKEMFFSLLVNKSIPTEFAQRLYSKESVQTTVKVIIQ